MTLPSRARVVLLFQEGKIGDQKNLLNRLQKDKGRELTKGEVQTTMKALTLLKTKGSIKKIEEIDDFGEEENDGGVKTNSVKKKWGLKGIKTSLAGKSNKVSS